MGLEIPENDAYADSAFAREERGSIIVVVATDAPLVAHQRNGWRGAFRLA